MRNGAKNFFVGTCALWYGAGDIAAFFLLSWPEELRRFRLFALKTQIARPSTLFSLRL
jgi:hypothetical protein